MNPSVATVTVRVHRRLCALRLLGFTQRPETIVGAQMVMDRWVDDEGFRAELRSDPEAATRGIGADLDAEQLEFLRAVDWTLSDEELEALLNKMAWC